MKVNMQINKQLKGRPDGTLKSGSRMDMVMDALTTAQAAGAPDGSNVTVGENYVQITWEEDR